MGPFLPALIPSLPLPGLPLCRLCSCRDLYANSPELQGRAQTGPSLERDAPGSAGINVWDMLKRKEKKTRSQTVGQFVELPSPDTRRLTLALIGLLPFPCYSTSLLGSRGVPLASLPRKPTFPGDQAF